MIFLLCEKKLKHDCAPEKLVLLYFWIFQVTVAEVQRRLSPPECLNASLLGGVLRRWDILILILILIHLDNNPDFFSQEQTVVTKTNICSTIFCMFALLSSILSYTHNLSWSKWISRNSFHFHFTNITNRVQPGLISCILL